MLCWALKVKSVYLVSRFENDFRRDVWYIFHQWLFYTMGFWGDRLCSAKANAESCVRAGISPRISVGWGPTARIGTGLVDNLMNVSQQCVLVVKMTGSILGYMSEPVASSLRSDCFSILLEYFGLLSTSKTLPWWPSRRPPRWIRETITGKGRPSGVLYGCAVA